MTPLTRLTLLLVIVAVPFVLFQYYLGASGRFKSAAELRNEGIGRLDKSISFLPCKSFVEHRLGLVVGVLFAKYLNRVIILPDLQVNQSSRLHAARIYDLEALQKVLREHRIPMRQSSEGPKHGRVVDCKAVGYGSIQCMEHIKGKFHGEEHIVFDCPFPNSPLNPSFVVAKSTIYWALVAALVPCKEVVRVLNQLRDAAYGRLMGSRFGFVHDGDYAADLSNILEYNGFDQDMNLIVSGSAAITKEKTSGSAVTIREVGLAFETLSKVEEDMLTFYLGLEAEKSLSNTDSAFGALILMERQQNQTYAAGHGVGTSDVLERVPLLNIPWVFFHNASDENVEYMVKAAVKSALRTKSVIPFCVLSGQQTATYRWLVEHNVTVIPHEPAWIGKFQQMQELARKKASQFDLSDEPEEAVSIDNALQIEIPKIMVLRQFEYVLFTTPFLLFRHRITLRSLGRQLPPVVQGPSASMDKFPFGTSIVLWNVSCGVENYENMLNFVEGWHRGKPLFFHSGGHKYFLEDIQTKWTFLSDFAMRSVDGYDPVPSIVDFSGMTPHEFARHTRKGGCPEKICMEGIFRGWCHYVFEWSAFLESEDVGAGLPVMKYCINRLCGLRGGCRAWKKAISALS